MATEPSGPHLPEISGPRISTHPFRRQTPVYGDLKEILFIAMTAIFLHYTQAELDDAYDQRVWARDAAGTMARLSAAGETVRGRIAHAADLTYGPGPGERLDWFHAAGPNAPIHFHVHGGAWRILTKHDAAFAAPAFVTAGMHHVVPDFSKLPGARLPEVVQEVVRALEWVFHHAREHGGDPARIVVSGHSSGAHVAAVLLTLDWAARGLPADLVRAAVCVGGLYDLGPVMLSARASYVSLNAAEVAALSPARHAGMVRCPVTLICGEHESPEFRRQTRAFAAALEEAGRLAGLVEMPGADHFDVNEAFGAPGSPVHRAVLDAA